MYLNDANILTIILNTHICKSGMVCRFNRFGSALTIYRKHVDGLYHPINRSLHICSQSYTFNKLQQKSSAFDSDCECQLLEELDLSRGSFLRAKRNRERPRRAVLFAIGSSLISL